MQVSSLISFGWNAFPTYGKSLTFARKCLRQRRLNDVTLRGPEMMKADAHKARFGAFGCQSASKFDPRSASNFDPLERRVRAVALAPSELVGVAETARARVVW